MSSLANWTVFLEFIETESSVHRIGERGRQSSLEKSFFPEEIHFSPHLV